jgi:hypothetical protein
MARLPSQNYLIQAPADGSEVILFAADDPDRTLVIFNAHDGNSMSAGVRQIWQCQELDQQDRAFACLWVGYFYSFAAYPGDGRIMPEWARTGWPLTVPEQYMATARGRLADSIGPDLAEEFTAVAASSDLNTVNVAWLMAVAYQCGQASPTERPGPAAADPRTARVMALYDEFAGDLAWSTDHESRKGRRMDLFRAELVELLGQTAEPPSALKVSADEAKEVLAGLGYLAEEDSLLDE